METEYQPKKAFIVQVMTVVSTCHSHNVAASRKRIEAARSLFMAVCEFDALFSTLVDEAINDINRNLSKLRMIDASDDDAIQALKSECLIVVRRLHEVVCKMQMRSSDFTFVPTPSSNIRSDAFGGLQAAV